MPFKVRRRERRQDGIREVERKVMQGGGGAIRRTNMVQTVRRRRRSAEQSGVRMASRCLVGSGDGDLRDTDRHDDGSRKGQFHQAIWKKRAVGYKCDP